MKSIAPSLHPPEKVKNSLLGLRTEIALAWRQDRDWSYNLRQRS